MSFALKSTAQPTFKLLKRQRLPRGTVVVGGIKRDGLRINGIQRYVAMVAVARRGEPTAQVGRYSAPNPRHSMSNNAGIAATAKSANIMVLAGGKPVALQSIFLRNLIGKQSAFDWEAVCPVNFRVFKQLTPTTTFSKPLLQAPFSPAYVLRSTCAELTTRPYAFSAKWYVALGNLPPPNTDPTPVPDPPCIPTAGPGSTVNLFSVTYRCDRPWTGHRTTLVQGNGEFGGYDGAGHFKCASGGVTLYTCLPDAEGVPSGIYGANVSYAMQFVTNPVPILGSTEIEITFFNETGDFYAVRIFVLPT